MFTTLSSIFFLRGGGGRPATCLSHFKGPPQASGRTRVDDDRVKGDVKTHEGVRRLRGANTGGKGGGEGGGNGLAPVGDCSSDLRMTPRKGVGGWAAGGRGRDRIKPDLPTISLSLSLSIVCFQLKNVAGQSHFKRPAGERVPSLRQAKKPQKRRLPGVPFLIHVINV